MGIHELILVHLCRSSFLHQDEKKEEKKKKKIIKGKKKRGDREYRIRSFKIMILFQESFLLID